MIRTLLFLILVFALGVGFSWLADRPGVLIMTIAGMRYEVTVMVAAVAAAALVATIMISWWLLKAVWNSPRSVGRYFRARKRDRGYQSLSTGMIAAGAGDTGLARRMTTQASKLLSSDQEPLLVLLDAQSSLLEGDHEKARKKFEAMVDDPETRVLGLRGLFLEAQRLSENDVARHYAERAAEIAPHLQWASNATLEFKTAQGEWDAALALVETQRSTRQIDKADADRRRAVLLTAKAMDEFDRDQAGSRKAAQEAAKLAPDLVPAAVTASRALFRDGDMRRGSKLLEAIWKKTPHPEIAEAFVRARPGDSAHDRLKRAERLASIKQNSAESLLAVARSAYEATEYDRAREAAEGALRLEPREGAYLLLADIEEAQTGDQGRIRFWLSKAVRAARDPAWTADGIVSDKWAPLSPVTGRLDAFEWRVPVEQVGPAIDELDIDKLPALAPATGSFIGDGEQKGASTVDAEILADDIEDDSPDKAPVTEADEPVKPGENAVPPAALKAEAQDQKEGDSGDEAALRKLPDDPGPSAEEAEEKPKRFRLF